MTDPTQGRVRCNDCGDFFDIDEGHVCPSRATAAAQLVGPVVDAGAVPDPNRPHPAGLTWLVPLTPRPIPLGPSEDRPEVRPALALDAHRFWSHARHGLAVGRARMELDTAAVRYALSADLRRAPAEAAALTQAAADWDHAITDYAKELSA